jgi:Flp pilus assembly protein TadD
MNMGYLCNMDTPSITGILRTDFGRGESPPGARDRADTTVRLALASITLLTFLPTLWNDFVSWDDVPLLVRNHQYRGLGPTQLVWMLTTVHGGHYIPLTWLSFALDYSLWGLNPTGYHLTNLLLHVTAVLLFFAVARELLRRGTAWSDTAVRVGAGVAALFFAIHPLRAETVGWVSDRKDLLSGGLSLVTVLLYLGYTESLGPRRRRLLWLSVGTYLLALASKSSVLALPLVLLLLDAYPLGRLTGSPRQWARLISEKAPYLLLSAASAVMAYLAAQVLIGPTSPNANYPWVARIATVFHSLWFYPVKTAFPARLSPLYEAPPNLDPWEARFVVSVAGVLGVTLAVFLSRRRWPAGLAAWTCYAIMLAPVSGIFPLGAALVADRYSYLPCLAWAMLVGAGAGLIARGRERGPLTPWPARLAAGAVIAMSITMGMLTWQQVQIWRNTETLWRHAVSIAPDCFLCRRSLGEALLENGAPEAALEHFRAAAALRPDATGVRVFLGVAWAHLARWPEAVDEYRRVLGRHPERVDIRNALANALHAMGKDDEAIEQLREALRAAPEDAEVRVTLGVVLYGRGEYGEAAEHLRKASELRPHAARVRLGLTRAYAALGLDDLAREQYDILWKLSPQLASLLEPRTLQLR